MATENKVVRLSDQCVVDAFKEMRIAGDLNAPRANVIWKLWGALVRRGVDIIIKEHRDAYSMTPEEEQETLRDLIAEYRIKAAEDPSYKEYVTILESYIVAP